MGAGASSTLSKELEKPLDASDVNTPRGQSAVDEVRRLRTLLLMQEAEHKRTGEQLDNEAVAEEKHEEAVNYEKALVELFEAADEDMDGELSLQEFRSVMQRADLGLSDKDIFALAASIDEDGNNIVVWREFLPVALQLVDGMEAQAAAQVQHMEVHNWADSEATELETLYAPSFELAIDSAIRALLEEEHSSGAKVLPKKMVEDALMAIPSPPRPEFVGGSSSSADGGNSLGGGGSLDSVSLLGEEAEEDDGLVDDGKELGPSVTLLTVLEVERILLACTVDSETAEAAIAAAVAANESKNTAAAVAALGDDNGGDDDPEIGGGGTAPRAPQSQGSARASQPAPPTTHRSSALATHRSSALATHRSSAAGHNAPNRPVLIDCAKVKDACLDARFSTLKAEMVGMTHSAMHSYLMTKARFKATAEENAGFGCGIEGAVMLTKPQLQRFFAMDHGLPLAPLQIMSLLKLAQPVPLPAKEVGKGKEKASQSSQQLQQQQQGEARFVDCAAFIPVAASIIENMFDLKFLVRRSQLLKRGALRPVELLHGPDREALEQKLAQVFMNADKDRDGGLSKVEFTRCIKALDLGLESRDIEALRLFADSDGDGVVNPEEFMRFAFSSLLHLLREQALQLAADMVGGGDAHEDGEAVEETDLAGNPGALIHQARTKTVIARKFVSDMKLQHQARAAQEILIECARRRDDESTTEGMSKLSAAVDVFTERAKRFNEAKERQLVHHLKPDMPIAESLFPTVGDSTSAG